MEEFIKNLNEYAKNNQNSVETITDEDMIKAIYYIDNLYINNEIDVLIFLLALNLFNAYAKQKDTHSVYRFKKNIITLINILNEREIPNIKIYREKNKGMLYMFKIYNIQFSFHDEKTVNINEFYYKKMPWDKIRKQPCAKSLFNLCLDNSLTNECITTTGKPIKILVNKLINDYHKNILTIDEIFDNI